MAELLDLSHAEVSKMERRSELSFGTLKIFIDAINGELVLEARHAGAAEVPLTEKPQKPPSLQNSVTAQKNIL